MINDVAEGHYTSLAAVLPFVPRALIANGKRIHFKNLSGQTRGIIDTVEKFDAVTEVYRANDLRVMGITMEREQFNGFIRDVLSSPGGPIQAPKSRGGLKSAMEKSSRKPTLYKVEAHHDLPWKHKVWFARRGIDVNNPAFGRWVAASDHDLWHKRAMPKFNEFWENWFRTEPAGTTFTIQQIIDKLAEARQLYPVLNGN